MSPSSSERTYTAFVGPRRIVAGTVAEVLPVLKARLDERRSELALVFDDSTLQQQHFDLSGSLEDVLRRALSPPPRRPGRPKLGVVSREVSLLPRHWTWLEGRGRGLSASLRQLVEGAMKDNPAVEHAKRLRTALVAALAPLAGDQAHYEEACRALSRGELPRFEELVEGWPEDVRRYVVQCARRAAALTPPPPLDNVAIVKALYEELWSEGREAALERLVAPAYTIHADPGDAWEGQTLDHAAYLERLAYSREAFPDLRFVVHEAFGEGERVSVRWSAEGTHRGDLRELPATGERLRFAGQTIYALSRGRVCGHWQLVDRLGFIEQLGPPPAASR